MPIGAVGGAALGIGSTLVNNTIGAGMGLLVAKQQDARQIEQQRKLNQIQIAGNKELAEYSNELQYDMWKKTGIVGQKEQLQKAGMNAGLLYGMSGAGGGTTGSANTGSVTGGSAPMGGGEMLALMNSKAQIDLMNAQIKKTNAEADNIEADTPNKGLAGENMKADLVNKKLQSEMQTIQNKIAGDSAENSIQIVQQSLLKMNAELEQQVRSNYINESTKETQINQIRGNYAQTLAQTRLAKANTGLSEEQTKKVAEEIRRIVTENSWIDIKEEDQHARIMAEIKGISNKIEMNDTPESMKTIMKVGEEILEAVTPSKYIPKKK